MKRTKFFYGYYLVGAAFIAQFVAIGVYSYLLGPFMLPMVQELDWTRAEFTLTRTISQFVMAFVGVFVGSRVDRFGGKPIMLIGATIMTITLALHSQVESLWSWWLLNGVMLTVGSAMVGNLVVNVTLSKWFIVNRGKAIAFASMGVSLGGIFLTPAATWMIDTIGWREAWLYVAAFTALLLYPVALMMRRTPEDEGLLPDGQQHSGAASPPKGDIKSFTRSEALRTTSFYALVLAFGFFSINIVVMLLQTVPYLTDSGFTRNEAAMAILIASVPAMISKPFWGYLIDRGRPQRQAAFSASVTGLSLFLIVAAVAEQNLSLIYLAFVALGLGWGGMIPLQEVIWASFFGRQHIGAIRGAAMPFGLALSALAPWLVSYYHDQIGDYHGALLVVAGLNVFSGVLIYLAPSPKHTPGTA